MQPSCLTGIYSRQLHSRIINCRISERNFENHCFWCFAAYWRSPAWHGSMPLDRPLCVSLFAFCIWQPPAITLVLNSRIIPKDPLSKLYSWSNLKIHTFFVLFSCNTYNILWCLSVVFSICLSNFWGWELKLSF